MKLLATIAVLSLLGGCASNQMFMNDISISLDGKQVYVNSMYGPIGVTSKASEGSTAAIRQAILPSAASAPK